MNPPPVAPAAAAEEDGEEGEEEDQPAAAVPVPAGELNPVQDPAVGADAMPIPAAAAQGDQPVGAAGGGRRRRPRPAPLPPPPQSFLQQLVAVYNSGLTIPTGPGIFLDALSLCMGLVLSIVPTWAPYQRPW